MSDRVSYARGHNLRHSPLLETADVLPTGYRSSDTQSRTCGKLTRNSTLFSYVVIGERVSEREPSRISVCHRAGRGPEMFLYEAAYQRGAWRTTAIGARKTAAASLCQCESNSI